VVNKDEYINVTMEFFYGGVNIRDTVAAAASIHFTREEITYKQTEIAVA